MKYDIENIADLIGQMDESNRLRLRINANPYSISFANQGDAMDFFAKMMEEEPAAMALVQRAEILPAVGDVSYGKFIMPLHPRR